MEQLTVYIKDGKNLKETYSTNDPLIIYQRLSNSLIAKKINCCKWIKSIKRINMYNGFQKILIYEIGGVSEFVIKN